MLFRRSKSLVGLDIGSSAVKAIELEAGGQGLSASGAIGVEPVPPDSIVDGAIIDSGAVADAMSRLFAEQAVQSQRSRRLAVRQFRHRQENHAAGDERAGAVRVDLLGSGAVHPLRHSGRQSRLPNHRRAATAPAQGTMEVLLVAAKKDKIADYTNVITQAGRTPVIVDVDAFALQNAYEANYGFRGQGAWSCSSTPAPAPSTSTSCRARSRSSRATCRWAATPSPKPCRKS